MPSGVLIYNSGDSVDIDNMAEINGTRGKILSLVAGMLLDTPSYDNVKILYNVLVVFSEACGEDCSEKLLDGVKKLGWWIDEYDASVGEKELAAGFTRLFFIGKYSIGSTASYYLSENHVNKQAPWDSAVEFYYKHKYIPTKGKSFDEDSAGVEILFLSILAAKGSDIFIQIEFYEKHLNTWLSKFCNAMKSKAGENTFFSAFGLLLEGFIEADYSILIEIRDILSKNA